MSADPADALGGRLPLADPATLTGEQPALFDRMMTRVVAWAAEAGFQSTAAGATIDSDALHALCARSLAGYKRPTSIVVLDDMPKNPIGKTDKAPLRAAHAAPPAPTPDQGATR